MIHEEDLFSAAWHTRRNGWVQGPFSLQQMRRMRDMGWLSRIVSVSVDMLYWRPAGDFAVIWNDDPPKETPPPMSPEPWRYSANGREAPERVTFGMLQVMAAVGDLSPEQLVWRDGMVAWRRAGSIRGLFGGPTEWCSACDAHFPRTALHCPSCGRPQQPYDASHRDIILPCGILGVCLFPFVPLWIVTLYLARRDREAIERGRVDPAGWESARIGEFLGWCGCGLTLVAVIAISAWFALSR